MGTINHGLVVPDSLQNLINLGFMDWRKNLGPEKVTNGTFTGNATGWTLNTGWTYNANAVDRDGAGTATMEQDVSAVVGEVYRVEYTISAYTDGSVTVTLGGTAGTARSSAATFVEYIKAATTGNLIFTPAAGATFTIDTVSVKKVGVVSADGVALFIEDRGATAGKGALHLITEDGTGHVFGDRVGIGTLYPAESMEINGDLLIKNLIIAPSGNGIFSAASDGATLLLVARNTAAQTQTVLTVVGAATVANSYIQLTNGAVVPAGKTLLIGSATAYGRVGQGLEVGATNTNGGIALNQWNDADTPITLDFNKGASDTPGTYTAVTTGWRLGQIVFRAADGTDWQDAAYIIGQVTGTVGADRAPGQLECHCYTDAATSVNTTVLTMTAAAITWNTAVPHTGLAIPSAGQIEGLGTGANGFKLKNLKNAAATALSGTQLDVEIDIGGTPYYFTVYPTKA